MLVKRGFEERDSDCLWTENRESPRGSYQWGNSQRFGGLVARQEERIRFLQSRDRQTVCGFEGRLQARSQKGGKELLGHSSLSVTMRYAHTNFDSKRVAVEKLDGFGDSVVTLRARR